MVAKKRTPAKKTTKRTSINREPKRKGSKIVRIQLDMAMEGDEPFDMPVIHPHDVATMVGILVMQNIANKDENGLYLLSNAKLRISMMDNPPKGMKHHEE